MKLEYFIEGKPVTAEDYIDILALKIRPLLRGIMVLIDDEWINHDVTAGYFGLKAILDDYWPTLESAIIEHNHNITSRSKEAEPAGTA